MKFFFYNFNVGKSLLFMFVVAIVFSVGSVALADFMGWDREWGGSIGTGLGVTASVVVILVYNQWFTKGGKDKS